VKRCALLLFFSYVLVITIAATKAAASPITRHDRTVVRFFHNHPNLAATPAGMKALMQVLPHVVRALASVQEWPPHHALWTCIHSHEARDWHDRDSGGNGHYGGLQMHPGWGYGTSYYASDDSQLTQEWAAERGYQANGYSHVWLLGQWAHYDCLPYA
jgi:hypothetical protein